MKIINGKLAKCDGKDRDVIEIPEGTVSVDSDSFLNCENVKKVFIPKSLSKIDNDTFNSFYSLEEFVVDKENESFAALDGFIVNPKATKVLFVPVNYPKEEFTVPENITDIGTAFSNCKGIKHLIINNKITKLEARSIAGYSMDVRRGITIPSSVVSIHPEAMRGFREYELINYIIGSPGSAAETFATEKGLPFYDINQEMSEEKKWLINHFRYEQNSTGITITKYLIKFRLLKLDVLILSKTFL